MVAPKLSIITTVYNRLGCLKNCLASVAAINQEDYEHIVVSDAPPKSIRRGIRELISCRPKCRYFNLPSRTNNWGITPAEVGLMSSHGKYVAFCSDDNGYLPDHFDQLVDLLDNDQELGFAYSSCLYKGERVIGDYPPVCGQLDLGQPLFRRGLFTKFLGGRIPFTCYAWDFAMVECFLNNGVKCQWVPHASFIFRLAKYPHLQAK